MKRFNSGRHGDLVVIPVKDVPKEAKVAEDNILARGESTGHKHQLLGGNAQILRQKSQQFIEVIAPCELTHEEHGIIPFDVGLKIVLEQHQYNPYSEAMEKVQD